MRTTFVVGLCVLLGVATVGAAGLEVVLQDHSTGVRCSEAAVVHADPVTEDAAALNAVLQRIPEGGRSTVLDLDSTLVWRITVVATGCWAENEIVSLDPASGKVEIGIWPTGRLKGRFETPVHASHASHASLPPHFDLRFQPLPQPMTRAKDAPAGVVACPIVDSGWECEIPAVALDLKVEASGFAPHYLWEVGVRPGEVLDLGIHKLTTGASVAGWVWVSDEAGRPPGPITVALQPEVVGGGTTPAVRRLKSRGLETEVTGRGFFQLKNVPLGSYELVATAKDEYSPGRVAPLEIAEEQEYLLEGPVVLEPLATLELSVDPPTDPEDRPWKVELSRHLPLSSYLEKVTSGVVSKDGGWTARALVSGMFTLVVADVDGAEQAREQVEIRGASARLDVALPLFEVAGRIALGDEPIETTMWWNASDGRRVAFISDADGLFSGYLSDEGEWWVDVEPATGRGKLRLGVIEVERQPDGGPTWVEIELPNTRITGKVVDEARSAVSPALVGVFAGGEPEMQVWVDDDGNFEVVGLTAGQKHIRAEARGKRDSGFVTYQIEEDRDGPSLELVVTERRTVWLRLVGPHGAVPGALIRFFDPEFPHAGETRAGPSGSFSVPVRKEATTLDLVILAPGLPTKILRLPLADDRPTTTPIEIPLSPFGGAMTLRPATSAFVVHNGVRVRFHQLLYPPENGSLRGFDPKRGTLTLPLASGEYTLCSGEAAQDCVSGYLPPGGSLSLGTEPSTVEPEAPDRARDRGEDA